MKKLINFILFALILNITVSCTSTPEPTPDEVKALEAKVRALSQAAAANKKKGVAAQVKTITAFYEQRQFRPVWIAESARIEGVQNLVNLLEQASSHGLAADSYRTEPQQDPIDDELQLTKALVRFAHDLGGARSEEKPVADLIATAIDRESLQWIVDELTPVHSEYSALRGALFHYEDLKRSPAPPADVDTTMERIRINMDRVRWMPSDLGSTHIRVNIPEYSLVVVDKGQSVLSMRVVVGKEETPTPAFSGEMTHIVFSPYWNIPESILTKETLPKAFEDPNYLAKQNIEIVKAGEGGSAKAIDPDDLDWREISSAKSGYRFRQKPGARNSLGLVKFMFPNKYNVYLHDTPADSLFNLEERDFSHGCVRIEKPEELAAWLLRDQSDWTTEKIRAAMHSGDERTVNLKASIPVHITYLTAVVGPDGSVKFLDDIYGADKRLR